MKYLWLAKDIRLFKIKLKENQILAIRGLVMVLIKKKTVISKVIAFFKQLLLPPIAIVFSENVHLLVAGTVLPDLLNSGILLPSYCSVIQMRTLWFISFHNNGIHHIAVDNQENTCFRELCQEHPCCPRLQKGIYSKLSWT